MNGFEAYCEYVALRAHFQGKYNYQRYNGKTSVTRASYDTRRDKIFFEKLAKSADPRSALITVFVKDPDTWIRDIAYSPRTEEARLQREKRVQSLSYLVREELTSWSKDNGPELFDSAPAVHPPLLRGYVDGSFCLETLTVLLDVSGKLEGWNEKLRDDPTWRRVGPLVERYRPFLKYDREKLIQVLTTID